MLILNAGNARSNAAEAEKYASEYNFKKAQELIKKSKRGFECGASNSN